MTDPHPPQPPCLCSMEGCTVVAISATTSLLSPAFLRKCKRKFIATNVTDDAAFLFSHDSSCVPGTVFNWEAMAHLLLVPQICYPGVLPEHEMLDAQTKLLTLRVLKNQCGC